MNFYYKISVTKSSILKSSLLSLSFIISPFLNWEILTYSIITNNSKSNSKTISNFSIFFIWSYDKEEFKLDNICASSLFSSSFL